MPYAAPVSAAAPASSRPSPSPCNARRDSLAAREGYAALRTPSPLQLQCEEFAALYDALGATTPLPPPVLCIDDACNSGGYMKVQLPAAAPSTYNVNTFFGSPAASFTYAAAVGVAATAISYLLSLNMPL